MTFSRDVKKTIQPYYTKDLVKNFYQPLLSEACLYRRVSGYFSTKGFDLYADGLEELAKNGGKVQFIISKEISQADYIKIKKGYDLFNELKPLRLSEQNDRLNSKAQEQLGNLAFMIATGRARVKVALTDKGLFHDKFGIISTDSELVFFSGSANETKNGISTNYESITVDVSWDKSENVKSRIQSSVERFDRLWNDIEPGVKVIEASELAYKVIAKYQPQSKVEDLGIMKDYYEDTDLPENIISFQLSGNTVVRLDKTSPKLTDIDRKLRQGSDIAYFFENDNETIKSTATYKDIERIIDTTKSRAGKKDIDVIVSEAVEELLTRNKYSIEQYRILGDVYRGDLKKFPRDKKVSFSEFSKIVQSEVSRPLLELHLRSAYYEYEMARTGNFSVPGAGKTAMILGVFAYLNRQGAPSNERIDRMLVVSPINAFDSWQSEFKAVFDKKKELKSIDTQSCRDFEYQLNVSWGVSNLVLVNYEALPAHANQLKQLINDRTMLIFDEVHRIKNPDGKRAKKALEIAQIPKFKYVLTGTPIPNSYQDIYNFLHILYSNEYNSFFGWDLNQLKDPKIREIEEINKKMHPFYWRTNKNDLEVPPAESDNEIIVTPSSKQMDLAESIYYNEPSSLAKLIRLIQASTNPSLVTEVIDYNELMSFDDDGDVNGISKKEFDELLGDTSEEPSKNTYSNLDVDHMVSPKFVQGIDLVINLVNGGKKVLVWGIFVDTIQKITQSLRDRGVRTNLVYGGTAKDGRVALINEFRDGDVQVLVSNPQTLGESISLHQTVHDAVYFEYDFNLTFMLQSRDRIHRLGLGRNQYTRYYYLQTKAEDIHSSRPGYIDQKIYKRLKEKEQIMYKAIDDNTLSIEYSVDEIKSAIDIIDEERKRVQLNTPIKANTA